jgi:hypothetical protein
MLTDVNICEQAETFRLLLLMGIVSKSEIIAWADDLIMRLENPPEWLLNISLAANDSEGAIEFKLRDVPFEGDRMTAAYSALDRFAQTFQLGKLSIPAAASILHVWASHSRLKDDDDWTWAMVPFWSAQELEFGHTSQEDVLSAINRCLAHFAARRQKI